MPRGLRAHRVLACLVLAGLGASAGPSTAFHAYLTAHPGTHEDDLLLVSPGDSVGRVLAVLHHPDAGYRVARLRVRALGATEPRLLTGEQVAALEGAGGDAPDASYLLDMTQACDTPATAHDAFSSWLYLPGNRLAAWDLQSFDASCRPEPRQIEASDHLAMRAVADALYRSTGHGRFRYGALLFADWDEAFAAPTRQSTLALLQKAAVDHPTDPRAQLNLAVGLHAAGDRDGAIRALKQAAALDPRWSLPHEDLALAYRQRGEHDAAERELSLAREAGSGVASGPPARPDVP